MWRTLLCVVGLGVRPIGPAEVEIWRSHSRLTKVHLQELENPNVVVVWCDNGKALAINYSDGGAMKGWHARLFMLTAGGVTDSTAATEKAVADFKSRHNCASGGVNTKVLRWMSSDAALIVNEVFPDSDCGRDLSYREGYLVDVPSGRILRGRIGFKKLAAMKACA